MRTYMLRIYHKTKWINENTNRKKNRIIYTLHDVWWLSFISLFDIASTYANIFRIAATTWCVNIVICLMLVLNIMFPSRVTYRPNEIRKYAQECKQNWKYNNSTIKQVCCGVCNVNKSLVFHSLVKSNERMQTRPTRKVPVIFFWDKMWKWISM